MMLMLAVYLNSITDLRDTGSGPAMSADVSPFSDHLAVDVLVNHHTTDNIIT